MTERVFNSLTLFSKQGIFRAIFWIFQLFPYNRYSRIPFLEDQRSWNSKINFCHYFKDYLPYFSEYPTHDPLIWPRLAPSPYGEILYMSGISTHTEYT